MIYRTELYRPVGEKELNLIDRSGWKAFPPRLPEQPIFYPVLNRDYAIQIARDWNTKDAESGHVGYVLAFSVRTDFLDGYEVHRVGGSLHDEYWIPAEDLHYFNAAIVPPAIRVTDAFLGGVGVDPSRAVRLMTPGEHDPTWDRIYEEFSFAPSIDPSRWPVWTPPEPALAFRFDWPETGVGVDEMDRALENAVVDAMTEVVQDGGSFMSLDWQHASFEVWPHAFRRLPIHLPIPVLPNGDYYLHLDPDLTFGILGQPWEQTITVFGSALTEAFAPPSFLQCA